LISNNPYDKDKEFIIELININWKVIDKIDESFYDDYDVMLMAVNKNGLLLYYASDNMKHN